MNLADLKALQQTAAAAVADLGTGVDQLLDDTGTEIRKLVNGLVHDCDRVTYQRDVAEHACRELRTERDALKARVAELMDLVDEAGGEAANIDTSLSDPQDGKLLVVRLRLEDAEVMRGGFSNIALWREQFVGWLEGHRDEGDTVTKPVDDLLSTPLAAELKAAATTRAVDVSHAGLPTPVVERCTDCKALTSRGHLSDCPVAAIVGGAA